MLGRYEPGTEGDCSDITPYPHEYICIFGFRHITVDGASCSRMFAEFIKYLNKLINNEEPEVTSMPRLPPVDLYMDGVIQPKWYHHVMQLVLEILCIMGARGQLVGFTNLGYAKFLDGSPDDDVILRARFGCSARNQLGAIFANNMVTFNGRLFWTVIHLSKIVSDATAQKYANLVKGTILKVIKDIND